MLIKTCLTNPFNYSCLTNHLKILMKQYSKPHKDWLTLGSHHLQAESIACGLRNKYEPGFIGAFAGGSKVENYFFMQWDEFYCHISAARSAVSAHRHLLTYLLSPNIFPFRFSILILLSCYCFYIVYAQRWGFA